MTIKKSLLALFVASSLIFTACDSKIHLDSTITTEKDSFSANAETLEIRGAVEAILSNDIAPGNVEISANSNLHPYIRVESVGTSVIICLDDDVRTTSKMTLIAKLSAKQFSEFYVSGASSVTALDSLKNLDYELNISGASEFEADFSTQEFEADLSGASKLKGYVKAVNIDLNLSGASFSSISGSCYKYDVDCEGASTAEDFDLVCQNAEVNLAGASLLSLTVNNSMTGTNSGASKILYKGDLAKILVENSGASSIVCKN